MKKNTKNFFLTLTLSTALVSIYHTNIGIAKAKNQKQYEIFNKLKLNSTIKNSAIIIYGKDAANKLCESSEDGVNINILCKEGVWTSNEFYKDGKTRYLNYSFYLYPIKKAQPNPGEFTRNKMTLVFKSKEKNNDLFLVEKTWSKFLSDDEHKLYNSKKIKKGMDESQLDTIMTGKGIGSYENITYTDYSKIGYQDGTSKPKYSKPSKIYSYSVKNQKNNKRYYFEMKYDNSKKTNTVSYIEASNIQ